MTLRPLALFLLALVLPACAAKIPYPEGPVGQTLRDYYANPFDHDRYYAVSQIPAENRAAATPTLLAIMKENRDTRALWSAFILSEWDPQLSASAPEFRRLLPDIIQGLSAPNDETTPSPRWAALASAFLLMRMGNDAAEQSCSAVAQRYVAPVDKRIEGESYECWTRAVLSALLTLNGQHGVPALIQGLSHNDPWVRECSINALKSFFGNELLVFASGPTVHSLTPDEIAGAQKAALPALLKIRQLAASDPDEHVRDCAQSALPQIEHPATQPATTPAH